jgi:hypothetical protein
MRERGTRQGRHSIRISNVCGAALSFDPGSHNIADPRLL